MQRVYVTSCVQLLCVCCAAGYVGVSDLEEVVYRTEDTPGLGFLLKRSFYDDHMAKHMDDCCMKRYVCSASSNPIPHS